MQNRRPPRKAPKHVRPDNGRYWMFGIHAVRDGLMNPRRRKHRLVLTLNAANQLEDAIAAAKIEPEICDPRKFAAPLDPNSVHQGAALETEALDWGDVADLCPPENRRVVLLLDRVSDPHNVGAILRSAEVFGATAVIAPARHSAPESGALAKAASGALERQPYLRVRNLADTMQQLQKLGYVLIGMDGEAQTDIASAIHGQGAAPLGIVLGAEGPGLRERTRETCDMLARISSAAEFASLNVSNAAAVALFAAADKARFDA